MTTGNAFQDFRASLDGMAAALGGAPATWEAVADEYNRALRASIAISRGLRSFDLPHATFHLMATDAELSAAITEAERRFRLTSNLPPRAQAEWGGAHLVIFGDTVVLAGHNRFHPVAMVGSPDTRTDLRTRLPVTRYQVFLTEFGKNLLGRSIHSIGKPTSTHAMSEDAAAKSAQRIVETFFKVKFAPARKNAA